MNGRDRIESVLGRIGPIPAANYDRMLCSFYGVQGTGKTRVACTFPKPLLLISPEIGTDSVVGTTGVDVAPVLATTDVHDLLDLVTGGKSCWGLDAAGKSWKHLGVGNFTGEKYRTVVLDTATKMRTIRIRELFAAMGKEVPRSQPFLYADKVWKEVWNQTAHDMKRLLELLLELPRNNKVCVVVNSQEANLTYDEGGSSSEILKPNVASAVGKSVSEYLNAECSYVGQMLIREKYEVTTIKAGDIDIPDKKRVGAEYVMRVGPDAVYRTKFRRPLTVTTPLPDFVVDPSYSKIVKLIKGEQV